MAASRFKVTLDELEQAARVETDETVESVDASPELMPDPRLPQPDRDWFASGG